MSTTKPDLSEIGCDMNESEPNCLCGLAITAVTTKIHSKKCQNIPYSVPTVNL